MSSSPGHWQSFQRSIQSLSWSVGLICIHVFWLIQLMQNSQTLLTLPCKGPVNKPYPSAPPRRLKQLLTIANNTWSRRCKWSELICCCCLCLMKFYYLLFCIMLKSSLSYCIVECHDSILSKSKWHFSNKESTMCSSLNHATFHNLFTELKI